MPFVEAHARPERGFFRGGKFWPKDGAIHELTPDEAIRVNQEPQLVVAAIAATREELEAFKQRRANMEAELRKQLEDARAQALAKSDRRAESKNDAKQETKNGK